MANEGSTKPTYSELETALEYERHVKGNYRERMRASIERFEKAEAALARVRGLLQRLWISVRERLPEDDTDVLISVVSSGERYTWAGCVLDGEWFMSNNYDHVKGFVTHWQPFPEPANFPQSSSLVSQGAESADIGKLDTADEKHACGQMGFNPSMGDTCAGCEARKAGADESGVEMGKVNRVEEK